MARERVVCASGEVAADGVTVAQDAVQGLEAAARDGQRARDELGRPGPKADASDLRVAELTAHERVNVVGVMHAQEVIKRDGLSLRDAQQARARVGQEVAVDLLIARAREAGAGMQRLGVERVIRDGEHARVQPCSGSNPSEAELTQ